MRNSPDSLAQLFANLASPFVDEEIALRPAPSASGAEHEGSSLAYVTTPVGWANEEEVLEQDDRTLVTDTLKIPNRWFCAIDLVSEDPNWRAGSSMPRFVAKARGSGVLIGPRYVLTARHIFGPADPPPAHLVKRHTVSPARNGDTSNSPFGKINISAIRVPAPNLVTRTVGQGSQRRRVTFVQPADDYALIILKDDVASKTLPQMKGVLGFWGQDRRLAVIRRLSQAQLTQKDIVVVGYPGDTCGTKILPGTTAQKTSQIEYCWQSQRNEWASTQWRSVGIADLQADEVTLLHTADTFEGESGAPIGTYINNLLHLAAIHGGVHDAQHNKGTAVTLRMLNDLRRWINADAGYEAVVITNDTLKYQPPPARAQTREVPYEPEAEDDELTAESEEEADPRLLGEDPSEERFDPSAVPKEVAEAVANKQWTTALERAIQAGWHDESELTNLLFFGRHPELPPAALDPKLPNAKQLGQEWITILKREVRPAIHKAAGNTDLHVPGRYVAERDPMFSGATGKQFKELVESVAKEAELNPGFLAAVLLAEWDKRALYLRTTEVRSFVTGTDDFYAQRKQLAENVPAFKNVHFDERRKTTNINEHGRKVVTVPFGSGRDAALATAVYLKYAEIKLRRAAAKNNGDFDALPPETRFALVRIAMAAGHGGITPDGDLVRFKKHEGKWVRVKPGQPGVLLGVASRLERVLKGQDILVRKDEPRRDPTGSGHVTNRNATILAAQAVHLSDWFFGIPVSAPPAPPQPEHLDVDMDEEEGMSGVDLETFAETDEADQSEQPELESTDDRYLSELFARAEEDVSVR